MVTTLWGRDKAETRVIGASHENLGLCSSPGCAECSQNSTGPIRIGPAYLKWLGAPQAPKREAWNRLQKLLGGPQGTFRDMQPCVTFG